MRLLRQVLRDGHGPARVGAMGHGAVGAVFEDGTRVIIAPDRLEISPATGEGTPTAVMEFADRLADLTGLALANGAPAVEPADPAPSLL